MTFPSEMGSGRGERDLGSGDDGHTVPPLHICMLANAQAVHAQRWAKAYAERGHRVDLLSIRNLDIPGVRVHTVCVGPRNHGNVVLTFLSYLRLLLEAPWRLRGLGPDVVNAHYAITHGVIAAVAGMKPLATTTWGKDVIWDGPRGMPWWYRTILRFVFRRSSAVFGTSHFMIRHLRPLVPAHIPLYRVPFGVDTDMFRPRERPDDGYVTIGFVKALKRKYGPELLIRAVAQLVDQVPAVRLVMAGRGPLEPQLRQLARDLGVEDRVEFSGFVPHDQVPDLLASFDIAVNCSVDDSETFGVVILEASAMGLPVVVADVGGVSEVVVHGETGLLVSPRDVEAIAAGLGDIIDMPEPRRREMGTAGRAMVVARYSWESNVATMEQHLRTLVGDGAG